ncbi:MAG: glutamate--cysteine ligase [Halothiobacillus sp. 20-53-49]|nr:MAG: glutamate--cysteine ligase [Halothiobacillus sp. 20-53-49]HUN00034.1 glutamate--cysteine ligase [Halothiobacillus sp.]
MSPEQSRSAHPELDARYCGPLLEIESHIINCHRQIEAWFRAQWLAHPAPFYASVDLRNAGFKLAPVDTNLFPAGFNNLNHIFAPLMVQAIQAAVEHSCPKARDILIIPERHTRNMFYLESLAALVDFVELAGFGVRIGSLEPIDAPLKFELPSGRTLTQHPICRVGARIEVDGFSPCTILLNNDLSGGRLAILDDLEQTVIPPAELGWWNRSKFEHFSIYQGITAELCTLINLDPWYLTPLMRDCGHIDFLKREGEECLERQVRDLLAEIQAKYDQHEIKEKPFVVIKADAGTYGMGVMTAQSPEEVTQLNRKQRTKMSTSKEGLGINRVLIQEGVHSFEKVAINHDDQRFVAEPVIYMVDHFVVGGFYRVHTEKDINESLNSPGASFVPLPFNEACSLPATAASPDSERNRLYVYGVVARLALLAAAIEYQSIAGTPKIAENPA